jgi:hypothetical protein
VRRLIVTLSTGILVLSGCAAQTSRPVPTPIVVTVSGPTATTTVPGPTITKTTPGPTVTITKTPRPTNPDDRFLSEVRATWPELDDGSDASLISLAHTICDGFPSVSVADGARIIVRNGVLSLDEAYDFIQLAASVYCPKYA